MRIILLLLSFILCTQVRAQEGLVRNTGRFRTVKQSFMTIYDTKMHRGFIRQQESELFVNRNKGGSILFWENIGYYRKRLIGKKWYKPREIYRYND